MPATNWRHVGTPNIVPLLPQEGFEWPRHSHHQNHRLGLLSTEFHAEEVYEGFQGPLAYGPAGIDRALALLFEAIPSVREECSRHSLVPPPPPELYYLCCQRWEWSRHFSSETAAELMSSILWARQLYIKISQIRPVSTNDLELASSSRLSRAIDAWKGESVWKEPHEHWRHQDPTLIRDTVHRLVNGLAAGWPDTDPEDPHQNSDELAPESTSLTYNPSNVGSTKMRPSANVDDNHSYFTWDCGLSKGRDSNSANVVFRPSVSEARDAQTKQTLKRLRMPEYQNMDSDDSDGTYRPQRRPRIPRRKAKAKRPAERTYLGAVSKETRTARAQQKQRMSQKSKRHTLRLHKPAEMSSHGDGESHDDGDIDTDSRSTSSHQESQEKRCAGAGSSSFLSTPNYKEIFLSKRLVGLGDFRPMEGRNTNGNLHAPSDAKIGTVGQTVTAQQEQHEIYVTSNVRTRSQIQKLQVILGESSPDKTELDDLQTNPLLGTTSQVGDKGKHRDKTKPLSQPQHLNDEPPTPRKSSSPMQKSNFRACGRSPDPSSMSSFTATAEDMTISTNKQAQMPPEQHSRRHENRYYASEMCTAPHSSETLLGSKMLSPAHRSHDNGDSSKNIFRAAIFGTNNGTAGIPFNSNKPSTFSVLQAGRELTTAHGTRWSLHTRISQRSAVSPPGTRPGPEALSSEEHGAQARQQAQAGHRSSIGRLGWKDIVLFSSDSSSDSQGDGEGASASRETNNH